MAPKVVFLASSVEENGSYPLGTPGFSTVDFDATLTSEVSTIKATWSDDKGTYAQDAARINVLHDTSFIDVTIDSAATKRPPLLSYFIYESVNPPSNIEDVETLYVMFPSCGDVVHGESNPDHKQGYTCRLPFSVDIDSSQTITFTGSMSNGSTTYEVGTPLSSVFPKGYSVGLVAHQRGWDALNEYSYSWTSSTGGDLLNYSGTNWYDQANCNLPIGEKRSATNGSQNRVKSVGIPSNPNAFLFGFEDYTDYDYNDTVVLVQVQNAAYIGQTPTSTAPMDIIDFQGTMGLEDIYREHESVDLGDYNDLVVRYTVSSTPGEIEGTVSSVLHEYVLVVNKADYSHSMALKAPFLANPASAPNNVISEVFSSKTEQRQMHVLTPIVNSTMELVPDDKELQISDDYPAYIRVRMTFANDMPATMVVQRPTLVFTTLQTGQTFESGVVYTPPGSSEDVVPHMQVLDVEDVVDFDTVKENGKIGLAYPQCVDFMRGVPGASIRWIGTKNSEHLDPAVTIMNPDTEFDPYFARDADVDATPPMGLDVRNPSGN